MNQKRTWPLILTVVAAAAAFLLSRVIWPDIPEAVPPSATQLPFFIGVGIVEAIGFGIGIAFLIFGWSMMRGRSTGDWLAFISAAWLLVSWWPHDNLHRVTMHADLWGLLRLEWGFHVTLIIAGVILASFVWKQFTRPTTP